MRQIKFRGRRSTGQMIFGDLLHKRSATLIAVTHVLKFLVDAESVAQLVGYDSDGAEVYEGDILLDELAQEYTAEIYDRPEKIARLKIKENHHEDTCN